MIFFPNEIKYMYNVNPKGPRSLDLRKRSKVTVDPFTENH